MNIFLFAWEFKVQVYNEGECLMKKILFLPFLQVMLGNNQVAKSLEAWLKKVNDRVVCETVDIFSYAFGKTESFVSRSYIRAIQYMPSFYRWLYKKNAVNQNEKERFLFYEILFEQAMIKLIYDKKPDWIICTHALPSYLLNRLKQKRRLGIPVVNVYTDYFINCIWGKEAIDYHLVPDDCFKQQLIDSGVKRENIFVTGIPIHPSIYEMKRREKRRIDTCNVFITGGNLGIGKIEMVVNHLRFHSDFRYFVLCGKNQRLYDALKKNNIHVTPLPYINSPQKMNMLYNQMDAIVTKPGGVTVTESLHKRIPIFVYDTLPGQEEMNLAYLLKNGLVFDLRNAAKKGDITEMIHSFLYSKEKMQAYHKKVDYFHKRVSTKHLQSFIQHIV